MVFQGFEQPEAESVWAPFTSALTTKDISIESPLSFFAVPAQHFWDTEHLREVPGLVLQDDRPARLSETFSMSGTAGRSASSFTVINRLGFQRRCFATPNGESSPMRSSLHRGTGRFHSTSIRD
jgi:hypothetical protein